MNFFYLLNLIRLQFIYYFERIDIEKAKEDARKIGIAILGAGFLGLVVNLYSVFESMLLIVGGTLVWLYGLQLSKEE